MVALLIAILPLPYAYYPLLRILITGCSAFILYEELNREGGPREAKWLVTFSFLVCIYNPVVPIHLNKKIWVVIDLASFASFYIYKKILEAEIKLPNAPIIRDEENKFSQFIHNFIVSKGFNPESIKYFQDWNAAKKAYFEGDLEQGEDVVVGTEGLENLVIFKFQASLENIVRSSEEQLEVAENAVIELLPKLRTWADTRYIGQEPK